MKLFIHALSLCLLTGLTGCAVPFSNYETVTVQTTANGANIAGAQCSLSNHKGTWVVTTPGSVSVHLGSEQLGVTCAKDGYATATEMINSSVDVAPILIEGAIASTVSGSAWTYPQMITVPIEPSVGAPITAN